MKRIFTLFPLLFCLFILQYSFALSQDTYFPPVDSDDIWEVTTPEESGWISDKLDSTANFVESTASKAFVILHKGRIVYEDYYNGHSQTMPHYWASAGKTLTSILVGIAIDEGRFELNTPISDLIGTGWTSCEETEEYKRQIVHHLSFTSTMDEITNWACSEPECFTCIGEPGTRWSYHQGSYTLLLSVLEEVYEQNINLINFDKVSQHTGINGVYQNIGENRLFFSLPRDFARFGQLLLSKGNWDGRQIVSEQYVEQMTLPSQELNKSYGFLTWLNTGDGYMTPLDRTVYEGKFIPDLPTNSFAGLGANGQIVLVVPDWEAVVIRMGDEAEGLAAEGYIAELGSYLAAARAVSSVDDNSNTFGKNSLQDLGIHISGGMAIGKYITVYDLHGRILSSGDTPKLGSGVNIISTSKGSVLYFNAE